MRLSIEFKVGLFVIFICAAALAMLIYIGVKKELFSEKVYYYVTSPTSEKVERGIPVKISGFRVGQVSNVLFFDVNYIKIEIKILKKHMVWFNKGTEIELASTSMFLGQPYLKVTPGPKGGALLSPGATIELKQDDAFFANIQQEVQPLLLDIRVAVANIRDITEKLNSPGGELQRILANVSKLTGTVSNPERLFYLLAEDPEPARQVRSIITNVNTLSENLKVLSDSANERIEDFGPMQKDLAKLMQGIDEFIKVVTAIGQKLDPTMTNIHAVSEEVRGATEDLSRLRSKSESTIRLGYDVFDKINTMWPLSRAEPDEPLPDHPMP